MLHKTTATVMFIMLFIIHVSSNFTLTSLSVTPNYAKSTSSQFNFTFTAITAFSSNFNIQILAPSQYQLTAVNNCSLLVNNNIMASAICSLSSNLITFSNININQSISSYLVRFYTNTARYATTSTFSFNYYNVTTSTLLNINTNYASVTVVNAQMTCSAASNSAIVGAISTYNLFYTPIVAIEAGSILQVQLTPWGGNYNLSNFNTTNTTQICNATCSVSAPSNNNNLFEIIRYTSLFTNASAANSLLSLVLSQIKNPPSTQPISITMTLLIRVSTFTQASYMNCVSSLSVSSPNSFGLINFDTSNKAILANNINTLTVRLTNPISATSFIRISTPLTLTYQYDFYSIPSVVPNSVAAGVNEVLINNLTPSNPTSPPSTIVLRNFSVTNPPYANKPVSIVFTTENLISGTYYLIDRSTVNIVSQPSTIIAASLSIASTSINIYSTYNIYFNNINPLIANSFIYAVFPSQINTNNVTCSSSITTNCAIFNTSVIKLTLTTQLNSNTNITITINNILNPSTTTTTSSFSIYTYYQDEASLVDQLTTGLTITATSVPLTSVILTPSNLNVGSIATYTLAIQNRNRLPATSTINITIPTTSFIISSPTLTSFTINNVNSSTCTMTVSQPFTLTFTQCINSDIIAASNIRVVLANINNPSSTKPTDSWTVRTFFNNLLMEFLTNNIIATMNNPTSLALFTISPLSLTANMITTYTFTFTFTFLHYWGDRILITLPTDVTFNSGYSCSSLTSGVTITCLTTSLQNMEVVINTNNPITSLIFNVNSVNNYWYASTQSISIQTTTNDTNYYYVEQATTTINYQPATITSSINQDNKIILTGNSIVSLTVQSPFPLSKANQTLISITVAVPGSLTPSSSTSCTTSYASAICTLTSSQLYTVTNLNALPSPITITFTTATSYFTQTDPFDINIKYESSTVATNSITVLKPYCTNPCKQCSASPTQCISCLQSPYTQNATLFPDGSTCLISCPSTYYLNGNQCSQCSSAVCLQCTVTSTRCTKCSSPRYLYNNTCITSCPTGYFRNDSISQCIQCQSPCQTCTNTTSCLSCISGFNLDTDTRCVTTCSNPSFIGIGGSCVPCTNDCTRCSVSTSNCTACDTTLFTLFNNTCTRICPIGYYKGDTSCQLCNSPCLTCRTSTSCLTCIASYYLYLNTSCTLVCPAGYLPIINACQPCSSQCATCSNTLSNCTSCPSGLLYYSSSCLSTCPASTYPYNRTCTTCIIPCVACTSSPNSCLSCISGLVLINQTCIDSCPPTGYYQVNTTCIQCQANCLTCTSPVNCSVCADGYNQLDGGCTAQCPTNYPIVINRTCQACESQCASCSITAYNCTSCRLFFFKFTYTCVQSCPITYYSNVINYECEDGLSKKIVFFPFLIVSLVMVAIIIISKIMVHATSFFTSITAMLALLLPPMYIFLISLLFQPIKQPNVNYNISIGLLIVSVIVSFLLNGLFFYLNSIKIEEDDIVRDWCKNNVNHTILSIFRFGSLAAFKVYRLVYSRLFGSPQLSLPYKKPQNAFRLATIFTIVSLLVCDIPAMVGAFSLAYSKILKDQIFYSSVECLVVTILCVMMSLIDIRKDDKYFEENEYMVAKKYVEKVNDSGNNLQDVFEIPKEEASVDGENYRGQSGGKFLFSKRDPSSFSSNQELYLEEGLSDATEAISIQKKKLYRINIFNPIIEEEAEYYEQEKFPHDQCQTLAHIEIQNKKNLSENSGDDDERFIINRGKNTIIGKIVKNKAQSPIKPQKSSRKIKHSSHKQGIIDALYGDIIDSPNSNQKRQSKIEFYPKHSPTNQSKLPYETIYSQTMYKHERIEGEEELEKIDRKIMTQFATNNQQDQSDNKSLLEYRDIKKKWNKIISKRQKIAQQIFGNKLQKIQQPVQFEKQYDQEYNNEDESQGQQIKKKAKRRRKKIKPGNKQLEEIYLQRLTEKKKRQQRDLDF